ncbi:50S ribosomal protein L31 [bacterium]|nr:50S ribosomal protein L31 [bacterium]
MAKEATKKIKSPQKEYVYRALTITCACGAEFASGSTLPSIRVDICSKCHPFFTGENRMVDAEGRIQKFKKKYNLQ